MQSAEGLIHRPAELSVCPPLPAQTKTEESVRQEERGVGWRDHCKGRGRGQGGNQDIRMIAGGGGSGVLDILQ